MLLAEFVRQKTREHCWCVGSPVRRRLGSRFHWPRVRASKHTHDTQSRRRRRRRRRLQPPTASFLASCFSFRHLSSLAVIFPAGTAYKLVPPISGQCLRRIVSFLRSRLTAISLPAVFPRISRASQRQAAPANAKKNRSSTSRTRELIDEP